MMASITTTDRWHTKMKITKRQLRRIIKEELTSGGMAKKSTDLDAAREAGRSRDQIGRVEAIKLIGALEDMGYTVSMGAVEQFVEFLQAMEESEDIKHGG